jgi:hypothetical protein
MKLSALRTGRALRPKTTFLRFALISVRGWVNSKDLVRLKALHKPNKFNDITGSRTRDRPACSRVPQPTTLPRTQWYFVSIRSAELNLSELLLLLLGVKSKKKIYPRNRPWRPIRLWDVNDHTLFKQSAHRWQQGCQPYVPAAALLRKKNVFVSDTNLFKGWVNNRD